MKKILRKMEAKHEMAKPLTPIQKEMVLDAMKQAVKKSDPAKSLKKVLKSTGLKDVCFIIKVEEDSKQSNRDLEIPGVKFTDNELNALLVLARKEMESKPFSPVGYLQYAHIVNKLLKIIEYDNKG